jgi:hypothetical protein
MAPIKLFIVVIAVLFASLLALGETAALERSPASIFAGPPWLVGRFFLSGFSTTDRQCFR